MIIEGMVERFLLNPKQLFILDGFGALFSAFLLGIVLVSFESYFGIPKNILYFLAFLPCLFAIYDFYCWRQLKKDLGYYLKLIAYTNLLYCGTSLGLSFYHHHTITYLGWGYIIIEILIVVVIAIVELKTAKRLSKIFIE